MLNILGFGDHSQSLPRVIIKEKKNFKSVKTNLMAHGLHKNQAGVCIWPKATVF